MAKALDNLLLGTSGWSYKEWIGPFYTETDKSMLRAYTKVFRTVEIDSTFYRYPSKGTVMGWTRYSPDSFVFTAKLPGLITHEKKLDIDRGIEDDLQKFTELIEPLSLSGKLGCLLIQLPPRFTYDEVRLERFFEILPSQVRFAVEFRDPSWMRNETWALLEKYRVAYAIVDEPLLPPEIHLTSNIAYFRWHGRGARPWYNYRYSPKELEPWINGVRQATSKAKKVYGFFNNHYHGYAVENCLQVIEMLGQLGPKQAEAKKRVENYFKNMSGESDSTLENFLPPREMDFESLIHFFVPAPRLKRAEQITDDELSIRSQTEERIEATVRDYHILIEPDSRVILHDCADWVKISATKKMCKHVAKLFLSMDREKATAILRKLCTSQDEWQFKPYIMPT